MAKKKPLTRIEQARKDLKGMNLDELLDEITVQEVDSSEGIHPQALDGWFGLVNHEGIIAYFGTEEEAFHARLDFINRILNN